MSSNTDVRLIYVTCPDLTGARALAEAVVADRIVACANILPAMQAVYRWEGKVETAEECVLLLKTSAARCSDVIDRVQAAHPYDVPAILEVPVTGGAGVFLDWVVSESDPGAAEDTDHTEN
ncbi:MAG: divalent-cation tolerance protein CutA [Pseudomonadota bacterium]